MPEISLAKILSTTKNHLAKLEQNGIKNAKDLLEYFPRDYQDRSKIISINELILNQTSVFKGTISQIGEIKTRFGKKILRAKFSDQTGSVELLWFNQIFLKNKLYNGQSIIITGKPKQEFNKIAILNPEIETLQERQLFAGLHPIYPESNGIKSIWFKNKIPKITPYVEHFFDDFLPEEIILENQFLKLNEAIKEMHLPKNLNSLGNAKKRLGFDELFLMQLRALKKKWEWQNIEEHQKKPLEMHEKLKEFIANDLPFELTNAQKRTLDEIFGDLKSPDRTMSRLLQGDVGSGKTIVAGLAILNALLHGYQATLMAPTEILAKQHYKSIFQLFKNFNFNIQVATGSNSPKQKKEIATKLASGEIDFIIGTHALIQEGINFKNLGLAVIDEQHRFGVAQRNTLKKHSSPHLLSMTATPIPRTLALTIYGDQELSIIDEMPKGRKPIITRIIPEKKRKNAYLWIHDNIKKGRQAFIICPLVDESDTLELKSVIKEFEYLKTDIFPDLRINLLHGKMKAAEKDQIMLDFKEQKFDILVATSVIEVGIDIPNASIILIEGAERFGLSQLHQFRGRVGRGEHQSYCFLFFQNYSSHALQRLKALEQHNSGFKLAEIDLELRGAGQVYGTRQSGLPDLKVANFSDYHAIQHARKQAQIIIDKDPKLAKYPKLKQKIQELEKIYIDI